MNEKMNNLMSNVSEAFSTLSLQDRMKNYEDEYNKVFEVEHGYLNIRLDGKGFSNLTKKYFKDKNTALSTLFSDMMSETCEYIINEIPGCVFGYTHSDEINLVFTDIYIDGNKNEVYKERWHNWRVNKMLSVLASMASSKFTTLMYKNTNYDSSDIIIFDARGVFFNNLTESVNNILWRYHVNKRNAKMQYAQKYCSHKELLNIKADDAVQIANKKLLNTSLNELLLFNNLSDKLKNGICFLKNSYNCVVKIVDGENYTNTLQRFDLMKDLKFKSFYNLFIRSKYEEYQ